MIARNCDGRHQCHLPGSESVDEKYKEFLENDLGAGRNANAALSFAPPLINPALVRLKAALTWRPLSRNSFRDQNKKVLLMMDSVTRFAMAQREVGLSVGEPPSTKGYTPSVFALLPKLMERAGNSAKGSITALYTVLVEGDDTNEPIADSARSILDGHIVLSRKLTSRGHYPPIDVLNSLSRTMPAVVDKGQTEKSRRIREWMAAHDDIADLVSIGAYKEGSNALADEAIRRHDGINAFLRQEKDDASSWAQTVARLKEVTA